MKIDYEKYRKDFEVWLNDEMGDITIGNNFTRPPSEVLYEMDIKAYDEQLRDFVDQKFEDQKEIICNYYPTPIAYYFYRCLYAYDSELERLHLLRSTWENAIIFLYAFILGDVNSKHFSLSNITVFKNQRISSGGNGLLSDKLGYKIELMHRIVEDDKNGNLLLSSRIDISVFDTLRSLNQKRNLISHSAPMTSSEAKQLYTELLQVVLDLLLDLSFLENVSILKFSSNNGDIHNIRFNRFMGHSLQTQHHDKILTDPELTNLASVLNINYILIEFDNTIFNVTPFLHFETTHNQISLCCFKKYENNGIYIFEKIAPGVQEIAIDLAPLTQCIHNSLSNLI